MLSTLQSLCHVLTEEHLHLPSSVCKVQQLGQPSENPPGVSAQAQGQLVTEPSV